MDEDQLWEIRAFVYEHFAATTHPPGVDETAAHFGIAHKQAVSAYEELHRRHALFLEPGTHDVRMANPFSGVETSFRVHANNQTYFANCAWDALGIPAALHVEAQIEAACAQSAEPIHITISRQQVRGTEALVHFLVPFRDWYHDLPFT
jgi:hypothetical protein